MDPFQMRLDEEEPSTQPDVLDWHSSKTRSSLDWAEDTRSAANGSLCIFFNGLSAEGGL